MTISRTSEDAWLSLRTSLQYAAALTYDFEYDPKALEGYLEKVRVDRQELIDRNYDVDGELERLSFTMMRDMKRFCAELLSYPGVKPYVRGLDGVRECLRCKVCMEKEMALDLAASRQEHNWWQMCDACMASAREATRRKTIFRGISRLGCELEHQWCEHLRDEDRDELFVNDVDEADASFDIERLCRPCIVKEAGRRQSFRNA